jgi:hypothetical protein
LSQGEIAVIRSGVPFSGGVCSIPLHPQNSPFGLKQLRLRTLHCADTGNEKGTKSLTTAISPAKQGLPC